MSQSERTSRIVALVVIFVLTVLVSIGTYEANESTATSSVPSIRELITSSQPQTAYRTIQMKVTGYSPTCWHCCGSWVELGEKRNERGVAADYSLLPKGTRLNIPGLGNRVVDDTGGDMRKSASKGIYHIDARFSSHYAAKNWGVKQLPVIVFNPQT